MTLTLFIYLAGFVLGMIILANFVAPKKLDYSSNLQTMNLFYRQVFMIHGVYIVFVLLGMMLLCVFYARELISAEQGSLTWGLCLFTSLFWGSRVLVQLFYYDKEMKRRYPFYNMVFIAAFLYLAVIFSYLTIY